MNGTSQKGLLAAICVVVGIAIGGTVVRPDQAVQILGFCSVICVSLLSLLHQTRVAAKVENVTTAVQETQAKVENVKETLTTAVQETQSKLATVVEKVEEVHQATNGLTDRLVEVTGKEQFAAGLKQGQSDKSKKPS